MMDHEKPTYDDINDKALIRNTLCEELGLLVTTKLSKDLNYFPTYIEIKSIYTNSRSCRLISKDRQKLMIYSAQKNVKWQMVLAHACDLNSHHIVFNGKKLFIFGIPFMDIDFICSISLVDDETRLLWKLMYGDKVSDHTREDLDPIFQHLYRVF